MSIPISSHRVYFQITIPTSRGYNLVGELGIVASLLQSDVLKTKTFSQPLILLLHGLRNDKSSLTIKGIESILPVSANVFRFDFSGHGESGGETSYSDYPEQICDVQDIVGYFKNNYFYLLSLQPPSIKAIGLKQNSSSDLLGKLVFDMRTLIGHSKGGTVSMLYASDHKNISIPYVINISGRYDLSEKSLHRFSSSHLEQIEIQERVLWRTNVGKNNEIRPIWVSKSDFIWRDNFQTSIFNQIAQNPGILAVLTVHGNKDSVVPLADAEKFDASFESSLKHTLKIVNNGSHQFLKPGEMEQLRQAINSWFDEQNILPKALL